LLIVPPHSECMVTIKF